MTFFAVTRVPNARDLEVKKVDINVWVLPGVLRQEYYCDIGLQLELKPDSQGDKMVAVDVTLPFASSDGGMQDLVPLLRTNPRTCNLVFGTNGGAIGNMGNFPTFDDGNGPFLLAATDLQKSQLRSTWSPRANDGRRVSDWRIVAEDLTFPSDAVYLRVRFLVENPGRVWDWQEGVRRHSHAIADIRFNEFRTTSRQQPNLPDYAHSYFPVARVNTFIIMSAKYKVGRVSPEPKYVRVLENAGWEAGYLGRRLTRHREDFIITYWAKTDVSSDKPVRSFIEVERRRPTAFKSALFGALLTIAAFVLLLPPSSLTGSGLVVALHKSAALIAGITLATVLTVAKILSLFLNKWSKLRLLRGWLSARLYSLK